MCVCACWQRAQECVPCERSPTGSPVERALIRPRRPKGSDRAFLQDMFVPLCVCVCVHDAGRVGDTIKMTASEIHPTSWGVKEKKKTCSERKYVSWIAGLRYNLT